MKTFLLKVLTRVIFVAFLYFCHNASADSALITRTLDEDTRITPPGVIVATLDDIPMFKKAVEHYELNDFDYGKSQYVDWIQSSLIIVRGDLWEKIGGLDERYFLFMSDPEICFRAWELNYQVFYNAELTVGADGKRCSAGGFADVFSSKSLQYHILDAIKYQLRHLFNRRPKNSDYLRLVK